MKTKMIIKNQKGAAVVEFAIVLPFLILLAIGVCDFGLVVYNKNVIINASREGARVGIFSGTDFKEVDDVKQVVEDYCVGRLINFSGSVDLNEDNIVLAPGTDLPRKSAPFGSDFSVTIRWDYGFLLPSIFGFGTTTEISARTLMKKERTIL